MTYKGYSIEYDPKHQYWVIRKGTWESKGWLSLKYCQDWIDEMSKEG